MINNLILFMIGIYLYFSLNKISLVYLPLFLIGLIVVIILLNLLYVFAQIKVNEMLNYNLYGLYLVELSPNKFSITINKIKTVYKYNKIMKIVETKNNFKIKLKNSRGYLTFEKNYLMKIFIIKCYKFLYKKMINFFLYHFYKFV